MQILYPQCFLRKSLHNETQLFGPPLAEVISNAI
uniref:Uncharacterized protein n=1 Tax=Anguilla anguilla TaxID=7936 RepID=A0A0E9RYX8_ANGAN